MNSELKMEINQNTYILQEFKNRAELLPSLGLAWIIGTLSGKGTVNNKTGEISLGIRNEQVQEEFIRLGEQAFGVEIPYRSLWTYQGGERIRHLSPSFFNTRIARALGDLSRTRFPRTIEENHDWILQNPAYTLSYTEGLFEAKGKVYKRSEGKSQDIMFQTSFPVVADFMADLLTRIGVAPSIIRMRMGDELRTRGVTISTLPEQKKFAELVHSLDPEKEEQLREFREASLEGVHIRVKSKDELVDEWRKMSDLLGHPPNSREIDDLWREGQTRWGHETYLYWFGESDKGKRFSIARKQLISLTNPELIQEQLNALARGHQRRAEIGQKRALSLQRAREHERRQTELEQALQPSRELAWAIGLLASGGSVNLRTGAMFLTSPDLSLQSAYINVAGNLFRTNLTWQTIRSKSGERQIPYFNKADIARGLGDLRRAVWPSTIVERHHWILEDQRFSWALLTGIFDNKGVFSGTDRRCLIIPTSFKQVANFMAELMTNVDIQNPVILRSSFNREGVQGVAIANIRDQRRFANNIHSVVPEKEQALEAIRSDTTRRPRNLAPFNEIEMVAEWKRLYDLLGHPPNVTDISELYSEGKTPWSAGVYARVFGRTGTNKGRRSYEVALEKLAFACGIDPKDSQAIRYRRPDSKYTHIKDTSDLVTQYRQLKDRTLQEQGHLPTTRDFEKARKAGLVAYSRVTFANYFGNGSLVHAIANLEEIIFEVDVNEILKTYKQREVKYVPKSHRFYDEEGVKRLSLLLKGDVSSV